MGKAKKKQEVTYINKKIKKTLQTIRIKNPRPKKKKSTKKKKQKIIQNKASLTSKSIKSSKPTQTINESTPQKIPHPNPINRHPKPKKIKQKKSTIITTHGSIKQQYRCKTIITNKTIKLLRK